MTLDKTQKIIAIALGLGTIGGTVGGVWLGARGKAEASEVRQHTYRLGIVETKATAIETRNRDIYDLVVEQHKDIRDLRFQLNRLAETGRVPFVPLKK